MLVIQNCCDNDACTVDSCDSSQGGCVHTPLVITLVDWKKNVILKLVVYSTLCCDKDPCADSWHKYWFNLQQGCVHRDVEVDDGNDCITDSCVPGSGKSVCTDDCCIPSFGCTHSLVDCDYYDQTHDTSDATSGCIYWDKACDDYVPSTQDSCYGESDENGNRYNACDAIHKQCDDYSSCTTEYCDVTNGNYGFTAVPCDDYDACITDDCDDGYWMLLHTFSLWWLQCMYG